MTSTHNVSYYRDYFTMIYSMVSILRIVAVRINPHECTIFNLYGLIVYKYCRSNFCFNNKS